MTETKLRTTHISRLQLLQQLGAVQSDPTKKVLHNFIRLAFDTRKRGFNRTSQVFVGDTKNHLLLLSALGKVDLEK